MLAMIAALLAAALTATTPSAYYRAEPPRADARPALWVVNDHDTVIYLFGTFHALDGRSEWFNDEVRTAFTQSDELILETLVPKELPHFSRSAVSERPFGPVGPVAGSASFLSNSKLVISAGRSRGMSTDKGADTVLRNAAEQEGKSLGSLESFQFQMNVLTSMSGTAEPAAATRTEATRLNAALAGILAELQSAWNRGDVESFAPLLEQMRAQSPENYRLLFHDRNRRWAGWIAQRLQQPGTVFVAVGAGHLAGRDSVQHKLALSGIRSARIN